MGGEEGPSEGNLTYRRPLRVPTPLDLAPWPRQFRLDRVDASGHCSTIADGLIQNNGTALVGWRGADRATCYPKGVEEALEQLGDPGVRIVFRRHPGML